VAAANDAAWWSVRVEFVINDRHCAAIQERVRSEWTMPSTVATDGGTGSADAPLLGIVFRVTAPDLASAAAIAVTTAMHATGLSEDHVYGVTVLRATMLMGAPEDGFPPILD
jgi:hypothetical protein